MLFTAGVNALALIDVKIRIINIVTTYLLITESARPFQLLFTLIFSKYINIKVIKTFQFHDKKIILFKSQYINEISA